MKAIRYIIFIPIIFMIVGLVYTLLPLTLFGLMSLSKGWLIILLVLFGGVSAWIFSLLPGVISWLSSKISPSKSFAFYSVLMISVLLGVLQLIGFWTNPIIEEKGSGTFLGIILTCLTIGFAASLSIGAGVEIFERNKGGITVMLSIGTIVFYIGMFLVFCLLSTKISYINPDKSYSWYSGIWHGLFVIPHWIVSWFSDEIYCKAPNATISYSIWWWISFIFGGLSLLGGGSRGGRSRNY